MTSDQNSGSSGDSGERPTDVERRALVRALAVDRDRTVVHFHQLNQREELAVLGFGEAGENSPGWLFVSYLATLFVRGLGPFQF